jgi:hypothetical protein
MNKGGLVLILSHLSLMLLLVYVLDIQIVWVYVIESVLVIGLSIIMSELNTTPTFDDVYTWNEGYDTGRKDIIEELNVELNKLKSNG